MEFILLILIARMCAKLVANPLHNLSYTDNTLVGHGFENMLFVLLSVSFTMPICMGYNILDMIKCLILLLCLSFITFTDAESGYIYDRFNILIACIGLLIILTNFSLDSFKYHLLGSMIGGGFLELMNGLSIIILKKEGIGGGDIKLCFACGLVLGFNGIILAFLLAFLPAAAFSLFISQGSNRSIALGPFLCLSVALTYCLALV